MPSAPGRRAQRQTFCSGYGSEPVLGFLGDANVGVSHCRAPSHSPLLRVRTRSTNAGFGCFEADMPDPAAFIIGAVLGALARMATAKTPPTDSMQRTRYPGMWTAGQAVRSVVAYRCDADQFGASGFSARVAEGGALSNRVTRYPTPSLNCGVVGGSSAPRVDSGNGAGLSRCREGDGSVLSVGGFALPENSWRGGHAAALSARADLW